MSCRGSSEHPVRTADESRRSDCMPDNRRHHDIEVVPFTVSSENYLSNNKLFMSSSDFPIKPTEYIPEHHGKKTHPETYQKTCHVAHRSILASSNAQQLGLKNGSLVGSRHDWPVY